jgi:tripartite-type tricarboxylate transporter receptor subunit TctC
LLPLVLTLAAALGVVAGACAADPYPSRPVRIIVTYPPGGTSDIMARLAAQILTDKLGKPFVVENKPGGGGNIGADMVAKSAPDGYTLLEGTFGPITTAVALYPKLPYSPSKDFVAVVNMADVPNILLAHPGVPAKTPAELVALAKSRPGKLNMAIASIGGTPHLLTEMFKAKAGIDFVSVPYKGAAPAITDLLGGQVDVDFDALPVALPLVKTGRLRALAVAGRARVPPTARTCPRWPKPAIPTSRSRRGMACWHPRGTPPEIVTLINRTIVAALRTPAMIEKLRDLGAEVIASSPEEMEAFLRNETVRWTELIRVAKITAE